MALHESQSASAPLTRSRPGPNPIQPARAGRAAGKIFSFPALMGALLVAVVAGNLYLGVNAAAAAPAGTARYCIFEGDTWWHVAVGKTILATHRWPTSDAYSFTARGNPWMADEWLGEVVMAYSDEAGGLQGLSALLLAWAAAIILLTYAYAYVKSRNAKAAFASCALLLPLLIIFFNLRPQLLGYIFLLVTLIALESFRQGRLKKLWFLPAVFLLWVNTHGTFALGFAVVALYWLGGTLKVRLGGLRPQLWTPGERRHLEIVSLLSLLAATLTPYGTRLTAFPLQMALFQPLTMSTFQEWKPPEFSGAFGKYFLAALFVVLILSLVNRMEYRLEEIGLLLLAAYTACLHTRMVVFFVMIGAGVLAQACARYVPRYDPGKDKVLLNAGLLALIVFGCVEFFPTRAKLEGVVRHGFPQGAVAYLCQHPQAGALFDKEFWGGYLIRELGPQQKVFIDGRADLYEESGVLADYLNIVNLSPEAPFLLRKYHIQSCLIEPRSALAVYLGHSPGWTRVYNGQLSVIFERRKEALQSPAPRQTSAKERLDVYDGALAFRAPDVDNRFP